MSPTPAKRLCAAGRWLVPPDDRPQGWERMGMAEPEWGPYREFQHTPDRQAVRHQAQRANVAKGRAMRSALLPEILRLQAEGMGLRGIAKVVGISVPTLRRALSEPA